MNTLLDRYQKHGEFIGSTIEGVHHKGVFDSQVLHLAAFRGSVAHVEAFIALGADIEAIGDLGLRPLHYAVLGGHADTAALLMGRGASAGQAQQVWRDIPADGASDGPARDRGSFRECLCLPDSRHGHRWSRTAAMDRLPVDPTGKFQWVPIR